MLDIISQTKLGNTYICTYQNDEYSYDRIIERIAESDAVIKRVVVSSDDPYLKATISYNDFLRNKDYFFDCTSEPGEASIRLVGEFRKANITIAIDPMDMENIGYTTDSVDVSLKDILGRNT